MTMFQNYKNNGQVMILSVVFLGSVLFSATAIAGLLLVYQIRQANDALNSAKAIFAADAAIEWQTYKYYKSSSVGNLQFSNGARASSTVITSPGKLIIRSQGFADKVTRALEAFFLP